MIEDIEKDFLVAYKARNEVVLSVLRILKSNLKNKQIELKRESLTEEEISQIIRREIKQRRESAADFEKGGRSDLQAKELAEISVLLKYLPAEIGDEEITKILISAKNESDSNEFGKIMSKAMPKVAGRANGSRVSALLTKILQNEQKNS